MKETSVFPVSIYPAARRLNIDTTMLMSVMDWPGMPMYHCHILEHEVLWMICGYEKTRAILSRFETG